MFKHLSKFDHVSEYYRQLKWLPFKKLVQLHSIRLMYCQYHHTKCIPLLPPIEFGLHHSHYDTRTAAHFANSKGSALHFHKTFFVLLHRSGGTIYLLHFILLLKTNV